MNVHTGTTLGRSRERNTLFLRGLRDLNRRTAPAKSVIPMINGWGQTVLSYAYSRLHCSLWPQGWLTPWELEAVHAAVAEQVDYDRRTL